jgi:mannose/fructose-specific phosphotransferase system component IIA
MSEDDAPSVRALVAGHGDLGAGLVSAVAQITGRGGIFLPLSNRGLGREELETVLRDALGATGATVVFTDLPGGSWTFAARRLQRALPDLVVVTGVNLAMLLDYCFHEALTAGDAARAAVEKGRSAMAVAGGAGGH